jgi:hypothetical protein
MGGAGRSELATAATAQGAQIGIKRRCLHGELLAAIDKNLGNLRCHAMIPGLF